MNRVQEKRQRLEELLDRGMVMVHLDATQQGVDVPNMHADSAALALNLSYRFRIPDFRVDDEGVYASLSFNREPYPCRLPWHAIFAIRSHVDDTFHVWPEDVPEQLLERARQQLEQGQVTVQRVQGVLPLEDDGQVKLEGWNEHAVTADGSSDPTEGAMPGRTTRVPYLRVIK
jgi:stringent starvation protein B